MRTHHINMVRLANAQKTGVAFVGAISDLSVTAFDDTTITLTWTTPTADNALDYFEVYLDGVFYENTTDATVGWVITGLTLGTSYAITLKTVDVLGNKSAFSNEVTQATTGFDFATNLMAYWKLATNALDSSGLSHDGTATGITYAGGYAEFGSGKYIDVADSNDFSFTDGVNDLSAHFLIPFIWDDKTGTQFFLSKRTSGNAEWGMASVSGNLLFVFYIPAATSFISISIPVASITLGVLNTLQYSYDGSKLHTGIDAYLNGNISVGTTSLTGTYTGQVNTGSQVRLGSLGDSTILVFKGKGKEWAIWKNRTMTGAEIQELHDRVIAGTPLI